MIVIINTGVANLNSVAYAVEREGFAFSVSDRPTDIAKASHVIFPGVGHAQASRRALEAKGLLSCLQNLQQPTLGICLGMQMMFERTEEGDTEGLGVIPGRIQMLKGVPGLPLPHMGWNELRVEEPQNPLFKGIHSGDRVYFVHSFFLPKGPYTKATSQYGEAISAVVARGNFFGVQFHPEKSGPVGAALLRNFLKL